MGHENGGITIVYNYFLVYPAYTKKQQIVLIKTLNQKILKSNLNSFKVIGLVEKRRIGNINNGILIFRSSNPLGIL